MLALAPVALTELDLLWRLLACLGAGLLLGAERELRGKPAGISTQSLIIGAAALFTTLALRFAGDDGARIVAQVVVAVGFLGGGIIIKGNDGAVANVTTAASVWFAAAIGTTIGYGWFAAAGMAVAFAVVVTRIPHLPRSRAKRE